MHAPENLKETLMKLTEILKAKGSKVWTIKEKQTILEALKVLVEHKIGALLVYNAKNEFVGIISERDIMRGLYQKAKTWDSTLVEEWMTKNVIVAKPEDDTSYIMGVMTQNRVRHIPVVTNEGKLEGMVSIGDVVKSQLQDSQYEIHYLKEYIYGRGHEEQPQ